MRFCSQKWYLSRAAKMSWWRSVVDKTTRLQYDTACIGYTQHRYSRCHLTIQRYHWIQNRWTFSFAPSLWLILSTKQRHEMKSHNRISWPFLDMQTLSSFSPKNITKLLFVRTLTFTIDLFTYWTVKLLLPMHFKWIGC